MRVKDSMMVDGSCTSYGLRTKESVHHLKRVSMGADALPSSALHVAHKVLNASPINRRIEGSGGALALTSRRRPVLAAFLLSDSMSDVYLLGQRLGRSPSIIVR